MEQDRATTTDSEITALTLAARDERAPAMGEILSQDVEFTTDFMALLAITPGSHPNTYRVLHIASLIGSYAVLYYKGLRDRPRPSQLCPALLPPIPMPGHASWPSGHATQAWLKALCMEHVLQGILSGTLTHRRSRGCLLKPQDARDQSCPEPRDCRLTLSDRLGRWPQARRHDRAFLNRYGAATTWFGKAVTAAKGEWV